MIKFILIVNKLGQTRLAQYYTTGLSINQRVALENEITRRCLSRKDKECSFLEFRDLKVIYRRYASLFFLVGVDEEENELGILEFIHCLVETLDRYFENVCELDLMFNIDKAYMILDEMALNGNIIETNKKTVIAPLHIIDQVSKKLK
ncbi:ap-4 complex subunit sigma-1 [Anaeramoeba flamelloides]|uniref:AP complex subunit sigma n=1 Tax=Anaeramoeba flamelloides TaxID=1746091 RepID=A0AAV7Z682_9EUKA|nr:ap-4 complex subunit sigma-1 [Anaeramoeba flamelloides]KAJ6226070.1 ap-4 complex subunit sigma-1 [Anaeramoeba flamelloides]